MGSKNIGRFSECSKEYVRTLYKWYIDSFVRLNLLSKSCIKESLGFAQSKSVKDYK